MTPKQRSGGQTGGWGGQFANRGASVSRGGRPSAGGGGTGKTPGGKGCAIWAVLILALPVALAIAGVAVTR